MSQEFALSRAEIVKDNDFVPVALQSVDEVAAYESGTTRYEKAAH
jgi:hypothetical protein